MDETPTPNGTHTPQTPKLNTLSLTEYTANPSPPSRRSSSSALPTIPEAFLLPNGFPDVRLELHKTEAIVSYTNSISV